MDTAQSPRMRADARRNRERLLAEALAAFSERGSDDTSLEEIARRAGVGIGTLYRHFPTRQSLLEAVYRDQVDALCASAGALLDSPSPGAALAAWLRALVQFSIAKRSLTSELLATSGAMNSEAFAGCRAELTRGAQALLARAQAAGAARPGLDAGDLLRLAHGVAAATERSPDRAGEAERLLAILLGGVLTPEHSAEAATAR
jgi:AcrR family transcriptional regulator